MTARPIRRERGRGGCSLNGTKLEILQKFVLKIDSTNRLINRFQGMPATHAYECKGSITTSDDRLAHTKVQGSEDPPSSWIFGYK